MKKTTAPVYVGMDVAKATLQVHLQGRQIQFNNDPAGHTQLCKKLSGLGTAHVICEATGGYEDAVARAFASAQIPVSVVNPAQGRHSAQAQGKRAKTAPPPTAGQPQLEELTPWLTQTIQARAVAKAQAEHQTNAFVCAQHQQRLDHYSAQIKTVEAQIRALLKQDQTLAQRVECLDRIVGVGPRSAWLVLAHLPELGSLNRQQAAALAGLAPWPTDSGEVKGARHIRGGRHEVRRALYMPALSAARTNPVLEKFYQRLIARNKPAKVALTAVMRKLLVHMNAELKKLAAQPVEEKVEKCIRTKKSLVK